MDIRLTTGWIRTFIAGVLLVLSSPALAQIDLGILQDGVKLERQGDSVVFVPPIVTSNTYTFYNNTISRKGLLYATITGDGTTTTTFTTFSGNRGIVVPDPDNNKTHILLPNDYFDPYSENTPDVRGRYSFTVSAAFPGAYNYDVEVGWLEPEVASLGELPADADIPLGGAVAAPTIDPRGVFWLQFYISEQADAQSLRFVTEAQRFGVSGDIYLYSEADGLVAPQPLANVDELELGADDLLPGAYTLIVTGAGSSSSNQLPGLEKYTSFLLLEYASVNAAPTNLGTLNAPGALPSSGPHVVRSPDNPHTYTFTNQNEGTGLLYATVKLLDTPPEDDPLEVSAFLQGDETTGTVTLDVNGGQYHILLPMDYFQPDTDASGFGDYDFTVRLKESTTGISSVSYEVTVGWLAPLGEALGSLDMGTTQTGSLELPELGAYLIGFQVPDNDYQHSLTIRKEPDAPDDVSSITNLFLLDSNDDGEPARRLALDLGNDGANHLEFGGDSGNTMLAPGFYTILVAGAESDFDEQTPGFRASDFSITIDYSAANSCEQYESARGIAVNTWHLLAAPCNAPAGTTMADLTSFREQEGLISPWSAFAYIPGQGYDPLTEDDPIPPAGTGFWLITSIDDLTLQMPAGSTPVHNINTDTAPCEPGRRCAMATVTHNDWNLTGNPLNYNLDYASLRLTNDNSQCLTNLPCSPGNPEHQADTSLFFYNEQLGQYVAFSEEATQVAVPWDGFWARIAAPTAVDPIEAQWQLYSQEYPSQFMFVTEGVFDTTLWNEVNPPAPSGFEAAHRICRAEADAAALPGNFRAWVDNPATQYTKLDTPYITAQGRQIAGSFGDLTDGEIEVPVNVVAEGTIATGIGSVLTGVETDGRNSLSGSCRSWGLPNVGQTSDELGLSGNMSAVNDRWTVSDITECQSFFFTGRLYCVSQGRPLLGAR